MTDSTDGPAFLRNPRPHILMITNHGMHDWDVRSGLQDTGGQNHYVNALCNTLVDLGYKVTIGNRGGFPDLVTGTKRAGIDYQSEHARICYLEGGGAEFIRKEDLTDDILQAEATFARALFTREGSQFTLLISHYWDGAVVTDHIKEQMGITARHIWIPHSLGALKQENFAGKPAEVIAACRFPERIAFEKAMLPKLAAVASTSGDISRIATDFYGRTPELFLPPCIETTKVHPVDPETCQAIYDFLAQEDPLTGPHVKGQSTILEVSRTDQTKRKDLLMTAFAQVLRTHPESKLLLTISKDSRQLYAELTALMSSLGVRHRVVCLGMIPRALISELYAITTVYCSPSEMEGFGMSVQEACACRRATVSSDLVPFAVEYLQPTDAGVVVPAGDTQGFAQALTTLLADDERRTTMAQRAYDVTIPYFTWKNMTQRMLQSVSLREGTK